jgi:mevalonate kinase
LREPVAASAPGKVIITGEHFVVHGSYAVAAAINKRATIEISESNSGSSIVYSNKTRSPLFLNDGRFVAVKKVARSILEEYGKGGESIALSISSEIPDGSGLGSSAAVSIATAASLLRFLGRNDDYDNISKFASLGEKEVHGNPSGIDISACLNGGIILFNKKSGAKPVPMDRAIQLLVVFSGKKRRTKSLVEKVSERRKDYPSFFENLTGAMSFLSLDVVDALTSGDLPRLGALMTLANASLSWIGVSTTLLDQLVERANAKGSYGAKLTGAGGGGSIIALPKPDLATSILKSIGQNFRFSFLTSLPQKGLTWEE